jgi:hypothetical protein
VPIEEEEEDISVSAGIDWDDRSSIPNRTRKNPFAIASKMGTSLLSNG